MDRVELPDDGGVFTLVIGGEDLEVDAAELSHEFGLLYTPEDPTSSEVPKEAVPAYLRGVQELFQRRYGVKISYNQASHITRAVRERWLGVQKKTSATPDSSSSTASTLSIGPSGVEKSTMPADEESKPSSKSLKDESPEASKEKPH